MKKLLYICLLAFGFSACQTSPKDTQNIVTPTPNGVPSAQSATPSGPAQQNATAGERPANNPAHGQPFHDCSIPVGAPLNAKIRLRLPARLRLLHLHHSKYLQAIKK
ncbi:hypothetical protein [Pedobacter steynii]